ncbi:hypothetical protein EWE75_08670 [Sphingomonas populi]|uniref:Uncharacterized protein n=1 Tax=Sphingomonas populi TaxID=2484750 RepID=A0A4Q6Y6T1_9SPHN|nr:hypothetical protein [Sphingomonas populi]RZF64926.1 hypothetical protein EWE75_08670 [Sphingomonas populi]
MKEIRAFLLSPVPAALLGALVSWATGGFPRPISIAVFYLLLLYIAQLLFGLAVRAFLINKMRKSPVDFAFGGAVMTGIPSITYLLWATIQREAHWAQGIEVLAVWLVLGALTGLSYWRLSRPSVKAPARA